MIVSKRHHSWSRYEWKQAINIKVDQATIEFPTGRWKLEELTYRAKLKHKTFNYLKQNFSTQKQSNKKKFILWKDDARHYAIRDGIRRDLAALRYLTRPSVAALHSVFFNMLSQDIVPFQIPISDILHNLRHLGLYVCALTDDHGQRYERDPILPEYAASPNNLHARQLTRMAEPAPNPEPSTINSRNILDLDALDFPPSFCLWSLHFGGVSIPWRKLLSLIGQSRETIRYIDMSLVKLNSGTWKQVLLPFCSLSRLLDFHIDQCGYPAGSPLVPYLLPDTYGAGEAPANIEALSSFDLAVPKVGGSYTGK